MSAEGSLTLEEALALRQGKLDRLREQNAAYPNDFRPSCRVADVAGLDLGARVSLAGRLVSRRSAGKACFANIEDGSGAVQVYANNQAPEVLAWLADLDFGDLVGIGGELFRTKKGELTVGLDQGRVLAKCLQNFTPKSAPTEDRERKRRYLSMAIRPQLRQRFRMRSKLVGRLRSFLEDEGYLEVETPMLHNVQGGAAARPFTTEFEALGDTRYLRIAPELYLKRLLVGGYEKVYEINRSFRNEGVSDQHNPEFTMLEFYAAYQRCEDFMELTERMVRHLSAFDWRPWDGPGDRQGWFKWGGHDIELDRVFARMTMSEALRERHGWNEEQLADVDYLRAQADKLAGEKAQRAVGGDDFGALWALLFEKTVEETLVQPTFIMDIPSSVSPLARRRDDNAAIAERFEFFVGGREIANGFSELNDPEEQARVFEEQVRRASEGDLEAMAYDEDYINALRYGMPPAAGEGVGIDRLAMLLLGCDSIRDVIMFPQQRPEADGRG